MNENGDLRINGSGSATGGKYGRVRISGSGKITGDIECDDFSLSGSGEVSGKTSAGKLNINGSGNFNGDVKSDDLKINGSASLGAVSGGTFSVAGSASIHGGVDVNEVKIDGSVKVSDDLQAEKFRSNGVFVINGLLNAEDIDIRLSWHKSSAREIGGGKISIRLGTVSGPRTIRKILTLGIVNPILEADLIEGDEIYLENTTAKVVRGNLVSIGKDCDIGTVEYKEYCRKAEGAKVANERKI